MTFLVNDDLILAGDIDLASTYKLVNSAAPTGDDDLATKIYVDTEVLSAASFFQAGVGDRNIIGSELGNAGAALTGTAQDNFLAGDLAGNDITTGDNNIFIGSRAGQLIITSNNNIAVGVGALTASTTGEANVAIGKDSLTAMASGNTNTAIGHRAGFFADSGTANSIFIGQNAGPGSLTAVTNELFINDGASDTPLIHGDFTASILTVNGLLQTEASDATKAGLNVPEGVAPTVPVDGDVWVTAAGEFLARLDGVTVDLSAGSAGSALGSVWKYNNTTTASDPGAGKFRLNNTTIASATSLYINSETDNGGDFDAILNAIGIGDKMYIQNQENSDQRLLLTIASVTDNTGWWTFTFTVDDSNGPTWQNNKQFGILMFFGMSGSAGDVTKVGTPVNNQIGVWTGDGTLEGGAALTFNANELILSSATAEQFAMNDTNGTTAAATDVRMTFQGNGSIRARLRYSSSDFRMENLEGGIELSPAISSGAETVEILKGGLVMLERADHAKTPGATKGEIWVRSDTPNEIIFTDDAGTDHSLINEAPAANPTATTTELEDIADAINTGALKVPGYMVFNTTSGAPVWAIADTDGGVWNDATGTLAHTPIA